MNEQEKQAFEAALTKRCYKALTYEEDFEAGWKAALEYARGKQEPVAWMCEWEEGWHQYHDESDPLPDEWDEAPNKITALYTHPAQPVQAAVAQEPAGKLLGMHEGMEKTWTPHENQVSTGDFLKNEPQSAPALAQIIPGDSLFHCASDLENSATYDSHSEMQNCIRSVSQRIKALAGKYTAVAQEPVFWYRPASDGSYYGPIHNSEIEDTRKLSGVWVPLVHGTPPPATVQPAVAINEQMLEALKFAYVLLKDQCMDTALVKLKMETAISEAEAAKGAA